ncbi:TerD family protein [Streptomyces sp. NPDC056061]|uniref:TerD family protein n=1 Tax=Streptomyces sp. NPDC056061 TaxID=3345700 RepID=UPI0035D57495
MSTPNKDIEKAEVRLKWDPSPPGAPDHDLDIIAGTYTADAPYGSPAYLVHFDSRSPDGTINLNRDSTTGQGFGFDEVMTLELSRLSDSYARVVVGVAIQQRDGRKTFGEVANTGVQVREGYTSLSEEDFSAVGDATAATVAEFVRASSGVWEFRTMVRGFDGDPGSFAAAMGSRAPGA